MTFCSKFSGIDGATVEKTSEVDAEEMCSAAIVVTSISVSWLAGFAVVCSTTACSASLESCGSAVGCNVIMSSVSAFWTSSSVFVVPSVSMLVSMVALSSNDKPVPLVFKVTGLD